MCLSATESPFLRLGTRHRLVLLLCGKRVISSNGGLEHDKHPQPRSVRRRAGRSPGKSALDSRRYLTAAFRGTLSPVWRPAGSHPSAFACRPFFGVTARQSLAWLL